MKKGLNYYGIKKVIMRLNYIINYY